VIPNSVKTVGDSAFNECYNVTNITIPNSVTTIGNMSFSFCNRLTGITIPNSVTRLGDNAFSFCPLTSVVIPSSVTNLGPYAFDYCLALTNIYFMGNAPDIDSTAFAGDNGTVYYLPRTTGWSSTAGGLPTMLWVPRIKTADSGFGVQTNGFGFSIDWATGMTVAVEAATNLAHPNWLPIATNTLANGTSYFSDPSWTSYPGRFYRIRSVF
jgi:hypothetical protein